MRAQAEAQAQAEAEAEVEAFAEVTAEAGAVAGAVAGAETEAPPTKRVRLHTPGTAAQPAAGTSDAPTSARAVAPEPRFSLRDALALFEAMLCAPLEAEPTAQERAAWEAAAARHAETLADAATYCAGALHPQLFEPRVQQGWLAPSFAAALEAGPQALLAHAQQVAPGVFAFDMLSEGFCTQARVSVRA